MDFQRNRTHKRTTANAMRYDSRVHSRPGALTPGALTAGGTHAAGCTHAGSATVTHWGTEVDTDATGRQLGAAARGAVVRAGSSCMPEASASPFVVTDRRSVHASLHECIY